MAHVIKNKTTNVIIRAVSNGGSITLNSENNMFNCYEPKFLWNKETETWIEKTFTFPDGDLYEIIADVTLPDDYEHRKYVLTKNESNEWVFTKADYWDDMIAELEISKKAKPPKDPQPYPSWTFVEETWSWECPVALPDDHETKDYRWDEYNQRWYESTYKDGMNQLN